MSKQPKPAGRKVAPVSDEVIAELASEEAPRRKRRGRSFLVFLLLLLAAVWAAPIVIARTSLRNTVLAWATSDLDGSLTAESASLGWFSPIVAEGIEIKDASGERILQIERLAGDRSLARIAMNSSDVGRFEITRPIALVELTDTDSNWERVLAKYLAPTDEPSSQIGVGVDVKDGQVEIRDEMASRVFVLEKLNATARVPASPSEAINVTASGEFAQQGQHPSFQTKCNLLLPAEGKQGDCAIELDCDRVPLEVARAFVGRVSPQTDLRGALSGTLKARAQFAGAALANLDLTSGLSIDRFELAGPFSDGERLQLARIEFPGRVATEGSRVMIHQLRLATDVGAFEGRGAIDDPSKWSAEMSTSDMLAAALRTEGEIAGNVDLARLARLLPETFSLRPGLEITAGSVKLSHANRREANGWRWESKLETTRLAAREAGREISWDSPVTAVSFAHEAGNTAIIDRVSCVSDFLNVEGKGDANRFNLQGEFNLNQLANRLGQFADLGGVRLAGEGNGTAQWQIGANGLLSAGLVTTLRNFALEYPGAAPWTESQLEIRANAAGQWTDGALVRVETANCSVIAGADRLNLQTTAAVTSPGATTQWPVNFDLSGDAARWLPRAKPWIGDALADTSLQGALDAKASGSASLDVIDVKSLELTAKDLKGVVAGVPLDEDNLRIIGAAKWSTPDMRFTTPELLVTCRTLTAKLKNANVAFPETGNMSALGAVEWGVDLWRAQRWWQDPAVPPSFEIGGGYYGAGNIEQTGDLVKWSLDSEAKDVTISPRGGEPWKEPKVRLTTRGAYDSAKDGMAIEQLALDAKAAVVKLAGQISEVSGRRNANVKGTMRYDLAKVSALLTPYTGDRVRLAGNEERAFELSGPLAANVNAAPDDSLAMLRDLNARTAFGWQEATIFGVQVGKADFLATLAGGVAKVEPRALNVGAGKVTVGGAGRLTPAPIELTLPSGRLAENIEVTPEISNQGLMYIAPALANAAQAQGKFSLDLEKGARIPMSDVTASDVTGKLVVHSIEIAPSPLIQQFTTVLGLSPLRTMKLKKESTIPFRLTERRVYHENMELPFQEFTIRTHGSVGLDQSLSIIAEMPVPPKWLGDGAVGEALRNQVVRLPIGGTIANPRIDPAQVNQLAARFLRDAAGSAVQNQINRGLNKLFQQ